MNVARNVAENFVLGAWYSIRIISESAKSQLSEMVFLAVWISVGIEVCHTHRDNCQIPVPHSLAKKSVPTDF